MTKIGYAGYRFPPVIIQQAIWLYLRFTLKLLRAKKMPSRYRAFACAKLAETGNHTNGVKD
jgi:transposase-like protein